MKSPGVRLITGPGLVSFHRRVSRRGRFYVFFFSHVEIIIDTCLCARDYGQTAPDHHAPPRHPPDLEPSVPRSRRPLNHPPLRGLNLENEMSREEFENLIDRRYSIWSSAMRWELKQAIRQLEKDIEQKHFTPLLRAAECEDDTE